MVLVDAERGGLNSTPQASSWWSASEPWRTAKAQSSATLSNSMQFPQLWHTSVRRRSNPRRRGKSQPPQSRPTGPKPLVRVRPFWRTMGDLRFWTDMAGSGVDILAPLGATDVGLIHKMPIICGWPQATEMVGTPTALVSSKAGITAKHGCLWSWHLRAAWNEKSTALKHTKFAEFLFGGNGSRCVQNNQWRSIF